MEIRLSRYNQPFTEPSTHDVHYISLDDQRAIRAGDFSAHVHAFRSSFVMRLSLSFRTFRTNDAFEVFNPLTGVTLVHDLSGTSFFTPSVEPVVTPDFEVVDQLRKSRVRAASNITRCTCGNSRRPWRCTCHK
jgi:hypothetical protein